MLTVVDFVEKILTDAVNQRASDIHFESFEHDFFIKFRINGTIHVIEKPVKTMAEQIATRIKIIANLNIAERFLPQDGAIRKQISGCNAEFRVSTVPTLYGESIVLRVLNSQTGLQLAKEELSKNSRFLKLLEHIKNHNGLNIIAGPTGSGKTTTLYAILNKIQSDEIKILTCEDPVEYELPGAIQCNIKNKSGFSFATALRAFLRHDPDIILIGEIRDRESAELAVRAALTGHKVFATLHANGTQGTVPRLIDLGVDKTTLAEAISSITSQKLIKIDNSEHRTAIFDIVFCNKNMRNTIRKL